MCVDSLNFQALVILDIRDCCFHQGSSSNALCDDGGRLYSGACALYHHPAAC